MFVIIVILTRPYLLTYLRIYLLTYLRTYVLTYLLTYVLTYLRTYLLTYLLTYLRTYVLTYVLTLAAYSLVVPFNSPYLKFVTERNLIYITTFLNDVMRTFYKRY